MNAVKRRFVITPTDEDRNWPRAREVAAFIRDALRLLRERGEDLEILVRPAQRNNSDRQRRTIFMWHREVASELTLRTGRTWVEQDVHEVIFKPRFMPSREIIDPTNGAIAWYSLGLSDPIEIYEALAIDEDKRAVIARAMEAYLAWIYEMSIEVTIPKSDLVFQHDKREEVA